MDLIPSEIADIAAEFELPGPLVGAEPFGPGHINDSYRLTCGTPAGPARFLLQRLNTTVFTRPAAVMENILRVTEHILRELRARGASDIERRVLRLAATRPHTGRTPRHWHVDIQGQYWRIYHFIENTTCHDVVQTAEQAECAGRAFGEFQALLANLPTAGLHETIPAFHDTPARLAALEQAVADDAAGRVGEARAEIDAALRRRALADTLLKLQRDGAVAVRTVHNDAKLSNILCDADTSAALCVIDLDTVMPGLSLFDFGDMVRSMTCAAAEDERDCTRVQVDPAIFASLARGYLSSAGRFLTPVERAHLVLAGQVITLEQAARFLTDYLRGDRYYRIHAPDQNLARTRAQLALLTSLERHAAELERAIRAP